MNMLKEKVPKHIIPNGGSLDGDFYPMGSQSVKKSPKKTTPSKLKSFFLPMFEATNTKKAFGQWDFQGPPIMGPPYGKLPIPFPYLKGFLWE